MEGRCEQKCEIIDNYNRNGRMNEIKVEKSEAWNEREGRRKPIKEGWKEEKREGRKDWIKKEKKEKRRKERKKEKIIQNHVLF